MAKTEGSSWYATLMRAGAAGAGAGLAVFLVDVALAGMMLDCRLPLTSGYLLRYLLAGIVAGLLAVAVLRVVRRTLSLGTLLGIGMALLYSMPILERVYSMLELRTGVVAAGLLAGAAVLGYGAWALLLTSLVPAEHRWWPPLVVALTAASGLAVNRNLFDRPTAPAALATDLGILCGAMVLVLLVRRYRPRLPAMLLLALAALSVIVTALPSQPLGERCSFPAGEAPANLVLVVIDTLRHDVFQDVVDTTPEGQVFGRALADAAWFDSLISAAPWTAPSVGSLLTGLYPEEHGFGRFEEDISRPLVPLAPSVRTITQSLGDRGYRTVGIVTNPLLHPHSGITRGFDSYLMPNAAATKLPLLSALRWLGLADPEIYQPAAAMRRQLEDRLDLLSGSSCPFFLWFHLMDPHSPLRRHPDLPPDATSERLPELDRLYRDEVRYALREVAATFRLLQERGLWDSSVVVVVSDHGEMLPSDNHDSGVIRDGKPMLYGHGHALYEELVHVPLVIRPPGGIPGGRRVGTLVSHVDLHDSLLELLGVAPTLPERTSIVPWLAAEPPAAGVPIRREALIGGIQHGPRQRALRTAQEKLVVWQGQQRPSELYDLLDDPAEQQSLAGTRPGRRLELESRLQTLWQLLITPLDRREADIDPSARERLKALGYVE